MNGNMNGSIIAQNASEFRDENAPKIIFMNNIHFQCSEQDLILLFTENKLRVTKLMLHKDHETGRAKGSGLCEFEHPNDAIKAVQTLTGFLYKDRPIYFNPHKPRDSFSTL